MKIFKCYLCFSEFNDEKSTLDHLKKLHEVKEKINSLKCIVKNSGCTKSYQTWRGLKKHINTCIKSVAEYSGEENAAHMDILNDDADTQNNICSVQMCSEIPIIYDNNNNNNNKSNGIEHTEVTKFINEVGKLDFHAHMVEHLRGFALKVENLATAQNVKDCVFTMAKDLLEEAYMFSCASIRKFVNSPDEHISEILKVAQYEVLNEIQKYDTVYKRNKLCEENELYVKPEE